MSAESYPPVPPRPSAPSGENVRRGTLVALATIPAGVAVWLVVWGFGFIASIIGAAVAVVAVRLYLWGAGRISRVGAVIVVAITVATLLLAFFAGIVLDAAQAFGDISGLGAWGAFTHDGFWPMFWEVAPDAFPEYVPDFLWAIGFGALGSFSTLRGVFAATGAAVPAAPSAPAAAPVAPPSPDAQNVPDQV